MTTTTTKPTTHFDPVFSHWKNFATLRVWEVAAMMGGFEPRLLSDITDEHGGGLDFSDEERMLTSGVASGLLKAAPSATAANNETEVVSASLIPWLRVHGFAELADGLTASAASRGGRKFWTEERLDSMSRLRALHGTSAAAKEFNISPARVRKLLPRKKASAQAYDVFSQANKHS